MDQCKAICVNNFTIILMGACAGCMGPNRRDENYRVNRLTENSPIKSRVSPSELPLRPKDRILDDLADSKRRPQGNNLINTLLSSHIKIDAEIGNSYLPRESYHESPIRETYLQNRDWKSGGTQLKKTDSKLFDENSLDGRHSIENSRLPFASEFKTSNRYNSMFESAPKDKLVLSEMKNSKANEFSRHGRNGGLVNIPELAEEQSKTPFYVREIRKQNGEDVKRTDLSQVPNKFEQVPRISFSKYLKDLM